jgi:hypothetical protein
MKAVLKIIILVIVALTVGYNRGYYEGLQSERAAWESTAHLNGSVVRVRGTDQADGPITLYSNPHGKSFFDAPFGKMPVNGIDDRDLGGNTSRAISLSIKSH